VPLGMRHHAHVVPQSLVAQMLRRSTIWVCAWLQAMQFWRKAERVVQYKQQVVSNARKKEVMDKHLDFLVGQTQRYSTLLAQRLAGKPWSSPFRLVGGPWSLPFRLVGGAWSLPFRLVGGPWSLPFRLVGGPWSLPFRLVGGAWSLPFRLVGGPWSLPFRLVGGAWSLPFRLVGGHRCGHDYKMGLMVKGTVQASNCVDQLKTWHLEDFGN